MCAFLRFSQIGILVLALIVGGSALLMSVLVFLIPFRGKRGKPVEFFEDSQRRMRQHLEQIRGDRDDL